MINLSPHQFKKKTEAGGVGNLVPEEYILHGVTFPRSFGSTAENRFLGVPLGRRANSVIRIPPEDPHDAFIENTENHLLG